MRCTASSCVALRRPRGRLNRPALRRRSRWPCTGSATFCEPEGKVCRWLRTATVSGETKPTVLAQRAVQPGADARPAVLRAREVL